MSCQGQPKLPTERHINHSYPASLPFQTGWTDIVHIMADTSARETHTPSQTYLSTRGGDYGLSFETVVLKGLAADGGLFLPEEVPIATDWQSWKDLSYAELAFQILSLYISTDEIPADDLKDILDRSYSTFRAKEVTPLVHLQDNLYLLELFHGPSYSFKDCALQFLGNLFEYFLVRRNQGKEGKDRHHLTVVGATSGDTGSAAIYGLRGKKDVSVFILHPKGRVSPFQERQMTTVLDGNVHNMAVTGTFDDCQDIVKALFADPDTNQALKLGAVNSINWARILAQIVYYFHAYFALARTSPSFKIGDKVRAVVPTGNFGDVLAGYFARRMGLPIEKLVVATNENDILDRFWKTGRYETKPARGPEVEGGLRVNGANVHEGGVRETLSPAMDILVSSNFERLLWYLAYEFASSAGMNDEWNKRQASQEVALWLSDLKKKGGFGPVYQDVLESARRTFESERVTDTQTIQAIKDLYHDVNYVLDPHTAVGVTAAKRSIGKTGPQMPHISLSTAHPAKFVAAVELALQDETNFSFDKVLPAEFAGLSEKETRVTTVENSWEKVREIVKKQAEEDMKR
ncbi:tryptophan synthase beta subunit-like PLP-dependent enzyme [Phialemonium atrogriseum]|uniref:Threonine synthase n=1 Tax=Phialemonium atrogriseum TaxID=1093897 RepID=A0AAJ0C8M0_9PEZI|nr:tryptophan synthase beta subunit-like PLP-dependent enzyme [Phialemonium atrogriseum]KAK1771527.1 tryptophan synthase beta subunit-like PLP-dependent enzyme [Phialemonium atrogriseum]